MKSIQLILAFMLVSFTSNAQLNITVSNIGESKGKILIAIYNSESAYMHQPKAVRTIKVTIYKKTASYSFRNLPKGYYAISLYQDLNSNSELDENFFGIPTEPYGFSNNARGTFGPPSYSESKFYYNGKSRSLNIKVD